MQKISIISGTNRENSYTEKVAKHYESRLKAMGCETQLLSLDKLHGLVELDGIYHKNKSETFEELVDKYIGEANAFIFIIPEYNGSFPGIVKVFLDAVPPSKWSDKKACITGISSGRAGNLRGMEHLTGILHYLKLHVYHNRLPISAIDKIFVNGNTLPEETNKVIDKQLEGFLKFS
jgi:chromate reductase, NAD(P)H dehydrogenase (quinone)